MHAVLTRVTSAHGEDGRPPPAFGALPPSERGWLASHSCCRRYARPPDLAGRLGVPRIFRDYGRPRRGPQTSCQDKVSEATVANTGAEWPSGLLQQQRQWRWRRDG
eukprot:scaffold33619_cov35-Tisochrysis_lutea.AAC.1